MRRMITDNQLDNLKSKNLKIIELDTSINQATITQEQMDIFFPKDAQGNIHKPDYYIVITDKIGANSGGFNYLGFWSSTSIRFNRLGTNSYYTWTIGPNDTKFTLTTTRIPTYYLHHIYIKTSELYITIISGSNNTCNINQVGDHIKDFHVLCSGYLTQGTTQGPITSLCYKSTDNKFYFSLSSEGKDYSFFQASDVTQCIDEVTGISVN